MKYIRRIILSLLLVAIWFTMRSPGAGEAYARNIYPYVSAVLSRFSSLFPFSVGDCLIYGSIVGLLVYVGCAIAGKCSWKTLAGRTVEYLLWVYVWFYMAWGLNYFRQDSYPDTASVCGLFGRCIPFFPVCLHGCFECFFCPG